jgi:small-conductance mechanosensitive channel
MFLLAILKDTISQFIAGLRVFMGHDVDIENLITLENGRKGRVTRHGITKTILISQDQNERTKIIIPNHRLANMIIEKELPQNGISEIKRDIQILKKQQEELEKNAS